MFFLTQRTAGGGNTEDAEGFSVISVLPPPVFLCVKKSLAGNVAKKSLLHVIQIFYESFI